MYTDLQKMRKFWLSLLVTFYLYQCVFSKWSPEKICGKTISSSRTLKIYMTSGKNESSEWEDTITAVAESGHSSGAMDVELTHTVFECDSKRSVFIQAVTNAAKSTAADDSFRFHVRCGKNAAILEKGLSGQKINNDDAFNSQLFTHRPLKNNEIFEVKLEKKNSKFSHCLGIGIVASSPDSVDIIPQMWKSPVAWLYHHAEIYSHDAQLLKNYGKNLDQLQVGDRVGVMRSEFGTLHFFINGVDQGPAVSNIPSPVYGLVELWYNAMKVSIVNS